MKLLIIRHADPDYSIDSLTDKGFKEAELLKKRLLKHNIKTFYCSPLGRAQDTAKPTLDAYGSEAEICDWLQEFKGFGIDSITGDKIYSWNTFKDDYYGDAYYDNRSFLQTSCFKNGSFKEKYFEICNNLDELLDGYGYVNKGKKFEVLKGNTDTIAFFCHFFVECVMLSHLLKISPIALWHGFVALPSSVTVLNTEEREKGTAYFRCACFGDTSHLYSDNEPISFRGRYSEVYSDD